MNNKKNNNYGPRLPKKILPAVKVDKQDQELIAKINTARTPKEEIIYRVMRHMNWREDKAELWYDTKNPLLGGTSPRRLVELDRAHKVLKFIAAAEEENK